MDKVELMKVEGTFAIASVGLLLVPSFELPANGKWKDIKEVITLITPDGRAREIDALFSVAHLNIKDPAIDVRKRWPILISLKGICKEDVPIGSILYASKATKVAVTGGNA